MRLQLPGLCIRRLTFLVQFAATALEFCQWDDAVQIGFAQAVQLMVKIRPSLAQLVTAGLQLLRQPTAPTRAFQSLGDEFRMRQEVAHILPNQLVQLRCRNEARGAALVPAGLPRGRFAPADIVAMLCLTTPVHAKLRTPQLYRVKPARLAWSFRYQANSS